MPVYARARCLAVGVVSRAVRCLAVCGVLRRSWRVGVCQDVRTTCTVSTVGLHRFGSRRPVMNKNELKDTMSMLQVVDGIINDIKSNVEAPEATHLWECKTAEEQIAWRIAKIDNALREAREDIEFAIAMSPEPEAMFSAYRSDEAWREVYDVVCIDTDDSEILTVEFQDYETARGYAGEIVKEGYYNRTRIDKSHKKPMADCRLG